MNRLSDAKSIMVETSSLEQTEGSRTRRALLTYISNLLEQGIKAIVGLVVTPIIIRGLGADLYGAWTILQQMINFVGLGDLRPTSTLKLTLAIRQHIQDFEEKRRQIGAALLVWLFTLPILLGVGAAIVLAVPILIRIPAGSIQQVQSAAVIGVLNFCLANLILLPENVLRGMNLDYKAMGLKALVPAIAGVLSAVAILLGAGLPGVVTAGLISTLIAGAIRFVVARNVLPWFGVARPRFYEVRRFFDVNIWVFLGGLTYLLLNSVHLIVIGRFLEAKYAGIYVTTGLVLQLGSLPIASLLDSGGPGMADLWGRQQTRALSQARIEMQTFAIFAMSMLGIGVWLLNESFLELWIGPGFYAGHWANLFIILAAVLQVLIRVDITIMDCMLELRRKTFATANAGIISIVLAVGLLHVWGLTGVAVAIFVGRLLLYIYLMQFVSRNIGFSENTYFNSLRRLVFVAIGSGITLTVLKGTMKSGSWFLFSIEVLGIGTLLLIILWFIGLAKASRCRLLKRASANLLHKTSEATSNGSRICKI